MSIHFLEWENLGKNFLYQISFLATMCGPAEPRPFLLDGLYQPSSFEEREITLIYTTNTLLLETLCFTDV